jgi:rod shape-determining protein MreC
MLGGLILLFSPRGLTSGLQLAFARVFSIPLSIGRNISLSARTEQQVEEVVSRREFNKLQNHLANVEAKLFEEQEKVKRLTGLYDRYGGTNARFVLADVISANVAKSRHELLINRGQKDGLSKGQFVLGDNSIIGAIAEASSNTARIQLLTDSQSKTAVQVRGAEAVLEGAGSNGLKVKLIPVKRKIKIGDDVYACKKPGLLDAAMKVGTVSACRRSDENPLLWDISVEPACEAVKLTDVAVIIIGSQK